MTTSENYFQFPIGALHFGKRIDEVTEDEAKQRLTKIIDFCVFGVGDSQYQGMDSDEISDAISKHYELDEMEEFDADDYLVRLGIHKLNVSYGYIDTPRIVANHDEINKCGITYGSQLCRMRSDIYFDTFSRLALDWRQFSTLCAIYTGIGRWSKSSLTYDRIGAMALGFNGQRTRDARGSKCHQLTDRQTMHTVHKLRDRKLFVCASPNRRHVFYSHRLTLDELIDELASSEARNASASDITARIQRRKEELMETEPNAI